jgi:hypothetical protein
VLESLSPEDFEELAQIGRPVFPFIDQWKELGYMREREEKKKEKN